MTKVEKWVWKETAEVIGVLGIIAGIVFLTLELRQNNELMAAEARALVVAQSTETWASLVEYEHIAPLLIKDRRNELLTDEEELRLNGLWLRGLTNAQYAFQETPEFFRQQVVAWSRAFAAYGSLGRTWSGESTGSALDGKDIFDPEFVEFMEANVIGQ